MDAPIFLLFSIYSFVILSLLWARFTFFRVSSKKTQLSAYLYDPSAAIHICATFYYFATLTESVSIWVVILACLVYIGALLLFWWGISTAKSLNFAFGEFTGQVVTSGPFRYIRHPFYASYALIWLTSALLFNSTLLWITLVYLVLFYWSSATSEEKSILNSKSADKYRTYCKETNRFIPRIKSWKS